MAENHWTQRIQTWLAVTLITLLVWLYAEGQAISEEEVQVTVTFVAPGQNVAIEPRAPFSSDSPVRLTVTFRGSNGQLAQVRNLVESGPLELELPGRSDGGSQQQNIVVRDALLNSQLGELGVNIVDATPSTMTLHVEELMTAALPVELADHGLHLADQPEIEPATVQMTLPARMQEELEGWSILARLSDSERARLQPNTPTTLSRVTLEVPPPLQSRWTDIQPRHVAVMLTVRKQTDTIVKELIPVELSLTPLLEEQYDFVVRQEDYNLRDVELTGPADALQQIKDGQVTILAVLRPTIDQVESEVGSDPTVIHITPQLLMLPPDVTVTSLLTEVPVTVTRR